MVTAVREPATERATPGKPKRERSCQPPVKTRLEQSLKWIEYVDRLPLTKFQRRLAKASHFGIALEMCAAHYRLTARWLISECAAAGVGCNAQFWFDAAADAERIIEVYVHLGSRHNHEETRRILLKMLRKARLEPFCEALEANNGEAWARLLGI